MKIAMHGRFLAMLLALTGLAGCLEDRGTPPPPADTGPQVPGPPDNSDASANDAGRSDAGPVACDVPAPTSCPQPMKTFADVEPIIEARCLSCHYGQQGGPWPLTSYSHVADWHDLIRGAMLACTMPPPDSGITMPVAERLTILEWLRCGYPR